MSSVTVQVELNMPRQQAWEKLRNLGLAHHYVPGIVDTRITSTHKEGVGASRNVYQKRGGYLQETVTEWIDGEGFTLRLHKGEQDAPFKNAWFRYQLTDVGGGTAKPATRLTTTMGYTLPMGAVGALLDRLLLRKIIQDVIGKVALSLKHYYEHGTTATKAQLRAMQSQLLR